MARRYDSKEAKRRILTACVRLFLEKGYDNTTIQDIVNELGGLTKGVTPLEMASAYGTFANKGVHVKPTAIVKIRDREISGAVDGAGVGGRLTRRNFGRRVGHDLERRIVLVHWRLGQLAPAPAQPEQLSEKGAGCPLLFF